MFLSLTLHQAVNYCIDLSHFPIPKVASTDQISGTEGSLLLSTEAALIKHPWVILYDFLQGRNVSDGCGQHWRQKMTNCKMHFWASKTRIKVALMIGKILRNVLKCGQAVLMDICEQKAIFLRGEMKLPLRERTPFAHLPSVMSGKDLQLSNRCWRTGHSRTNPDECLSCCRIGSEVIDMQLLSTSEFSRLLSCEWGLTIRSGMHFSV